MNQVLEALQWRYAVKLFDPSKSIAEEDIHTLKSSLHLSASSYGLQPWKFLFIQNKDLREKLKAKSWNQKQVSDCSHYVVFLATKTINDEYVKNYVNLMSIIRSVPIDKLSGLHKAIYNDVVTGPRSKISQEWASRQCYIALGSLLTAAAILRVDACPMEGLDPAAYDEILQLRNTNYFTVMACALGYRSESDVLATAEKVRFPIESVIEDII
ncbi:MAG: NAD(P)H-dependent oxidoreductase [Oligoflexia bacterium]|nr:NAD(P)H-dependent oxidoreductase [Oligoflexia bacterium]